MDLFTKGDAVDTDAPFFCAQTETLPSRQRIALFLLVLAFLPISLGVTPIPAWILNSGDRCLLALGGIFSQDDINVEQGLTSVCLNASVCALTYGLTTVQDPTQVSSLIYIIRTMIATDMLTELFLTSPQIYNLVTQALNTTDMELIYNQCSGQLQFRLVAFLPFSQGILCTDPNEVLVWDPDALKLSCKCASGAICRETEQRSSLLYALIISLIIIVFIVFAFQIGSNVLLYKSTRL